MKVSARLRALLPRLAPTCPRGRVSQSWAVGGAVEEPRVSHLPGLPGPVHGSHHQFQGTLQGTGALGDQRGDRQPPWGTAGTVGALSPHCWGLTHVCTARLRSMAQNTPGQSRSRGLRPLPGTDLRGATNGREPAPGPAPAQQEHQPGPPRRPGGSGGHTARLCGAPSTTQVQWAPEVAASCLKTLGSAQGGAFPCRTVWNSFLSGNSTFIGEGRSCKAGKSPGLSMIVSVRGRSKAE